MKDSLRPTLWLSYHGSLLLINIEICGHQRVLPTFTDETEDNSSNTVIVTHSTVTLWCNNGDTVELPSMHRTRATGSHIPLYMLARTESMISVLWNLSAKIYSISSTWRSPTNWAKILVTKELENNSRIVKSTHSPTVVLTKEILTPVRYWNCQFTQHLGKKETTYGTNSMKHI